MGSMPIETPRQAIERAMQRMANLVGHLTRGMTLGVRAFVMGPDKRLFLVRHSYVSGWHLPGGGVEPGETLIDALIRELREEGNLEPTAPPMLHGVFLNHRLSRRDHVAVFVVPEFRALGAPVPDYEIVAHGFFPLDDLPNDTTAATRARIVEIVGGAPVSEHW
jgi:ADP-ribose pyrophosphatase YjhB (NUDIX family)